MKLTYNLQKGLTRLKEANVINYSLSNFETLVEVAASENYISTKDILEYLEQISSKMLYKKVGIILSLFKDKLNIPESFFKKCHEVSDSIKGYFDNFSVIILILSLSINVSSSRK